MPVKANLAGSDMIKDQLRATVFGMYNKDKDQVHCISDEGFFCFFF